MQFKKKMAETFSFINDTRCLFWISQASIYTYLSWQEIWRICLQHNAIQRDLGNGIPDLCSPQVGD